MPSILIMAGGVGERFWPASRRGKPKQFLKVTGQKSMLLDSAERLYNLCAPENIFVVTTQAHRDMVAKELDFIPVENIIAEPEGRNTAPAIGLGMTFIKQKHGEDEPVIVLPADHYIGNRDEYIKTLRNAFSFLEKNSGVVTFGIRPTRPETGYGYIETGAAEEGLLKGVRFVEKPDQETAQDYVKSGRYLWNSGMFAMKTGTFFELCAKFIPNLHSGLLQIEENINSKDIKQLIKKKYSSFPKTSIDYGIMENLDEFYVIPADFEWDDLGSWRSLEGVLQKDKNDNVLVGDVVGQDIRNSIIYSNNGKLIAAMGIEDIVVVAEDDVVMLCPKDRVQDVKKLVEQLKREGKDELL